MKRFALAGLGVVALAGCPGGNDQLTLWLAPNHSEVVIQLIDHEPPPW